MTTTNYVLRPSLRSLLLTFLVHHNPFYLLSALCMLAGCYALNSGLAPRTAEIGKLLALIGVLNFYELILIALGLYLIRRRGSIRDGRTLLLLEIPFLVDLAFLNAEASSVSLERGMLLNAIVLSLALLKVGAVLRGLFGRVPRRAFGLIAMQLSLLLTMPSAFKWFEHRGGVTQAHFYLAWWALGLMLVGFELVERLHNTDDVRQATRVAHTMRRLYLIVPLASAVVHLLLLHWVYLVAFKAGDLSPLLIGVAFAAARLNSPEPGRLPRVRADRIVLLRILAPIAAVVLAFNDPPAVQVHPIGQLVLTPWMLTVAFAYLAWVYCFVPRYALRWIAGGALIAVIGADAPRIYAIALIVWQRLADLAMRLTPRTAFEWGVVAVGGAFAFLTLGAAVSLRREIDASPKRGATALEPGPAGPVRL